MDGGYIIRLEVHSLPTLTSGTCYLDITKGLSARVELDNYSWARHFSSCFP